MRRKIFTYILTLSVLIPSVSSCDWLDVDPELGMTETDVFGTYKNFKAFFDTVYDDEVGTTYKSGLWTGSPMRLDMNAKRWAWVSATDACDNGRYVTVNKQVKVGTLDEDLVNYFTFGAVPIVPSMFRVIRVANQTIANIDKLRNATPEQVNDLLGQAYFVRAFAHMTLVRYYGGMPYVDKALSGEDNWDLARLPAGETLRRCAEDFQKSYEYFAEASLVRRDPAPGEPGHLQAPEMGKPNGAAALGMKGRCLLWAASPLNNTGGAQDWADAAEACAQAIMVAEGAGFAMLPLSQYRDNFFNTNYTNEGLWIYYLGKENNKSSQWSGIYTLAMSPNQSYQSGACPTQNFVDKFETKWGDPLNTDADRAAAVNKGHYNEQNPYANRDPRLDLDVVHEGTVTPYTVGAIHFYYDPSTKAFAKSEFTSPKGNQTAAGDKAFGHDWYASPTESSKGYCYTGYTMNKFWRGDLGITGSTSYMHADPMIRMAELYLNYAEAVNEAFGPSGTGGNCTLTAIDAINKVRSRVGMPGVLSEYTRDKETFRDRVWNERNVELAFEGHHYYYDIRRWKIAPMTMTQTLYGMYTEKTNVSEEYPLGIRFERRPIPPARQGKWRDCMYFWPWPVSEANKMINFKNNEPWL